MDKLESLITQLEDIESDQKKLTQIAKLNAQSILLRLPKALLIQRICGMLEDRDLYRLGASCTTMRKVLFCPLGFKLLFMSRNANHIIGGHPQVQQKEEKIDFSMLGSEQSTQMSFDEEEDAIAQLHTLRAVKEFLTMKLRESVHTINQMEDSMDDLQTTLKYEKSVNLKLQSKINILQNQLQTSELQRQDVKENLSELNAKYHKIVLLQINQMEQDRQQLQNEKEQLLGHKKILIEEVYRLRSEVQSQHDNQASYREALQQVRIFMDSVDLKPVGVQQQQQQQQQ